MEDAAIAADRSQLEAVIAYGAPDQVCVCIWMLMELDRRGGGCMVVAYGALGEVQLCVYVLLVSCGVGGEFAYGPPGCEIPPFNSPSFPLTPFPTPHYSPQVVKHWPLVEGQASHFTWGFMANYHPE